MVVYLITNLINGKRYVGQTTMTPTRRFQMHVGSANNGSHYPIHKALRKYGLNNFVVTVIKEATTKEELNDLEIKEIAETKPEYNVTAGGNNVIMTDETRRKISKSHTGMKRSTEHCIALSKARKRSRPVLQIDKNDRTVIKEHKSITGAANDLGLNIQAIHNCLIGISRTSGGYIWKYR